MKKFIGPPDPIWVSVLLDWCAGAPIDIVERRRASSFGTVRGRVHARIARKHRMLDFMDLQA
jgi:hypothetical protein